MTLIIYVKPTGCFGCDKTKQKFTEAGIEFTAVDITTNSEALAYITDELGYSQAPVVVYEKDGSEDHWSGLNPLKITQVINLHLR
ncbi:glutaredoxin family protein [Arthrobacter echini]|uniref:Glutaredoxin family protein n=1 Tax=Arthrobacter echini TaxID=1529066 RepID=A0A5D0XK08_9MICC|nr:glutaredoxin family protein [Arthrobacter echini]TYC96608.1 glutaredoxin family protein [Arthrobacter echini]